MAALYVWPWLNFFFIAQEVCCNCCRITVVVCTPNIITVVIYEIVFRSTMDLSIEKRISLVEHMFCESDNCIDKIRIGFLPNFHTLLFHTAIQLLGLLRKVLLKIPNKVEAV